ncbi:hypothetical protein AVEN_103536-1, partial [Araneus ventricosus]
AGSCGLVVRSQPRDRRAPGSKPDSTEVTACMRKFPWTRQERRDEEDEEEAMDWWSRYYLSTGEQPQISEKYDNTSRSLPVEWVEPEMEMNVSNHGNLSALLRLSTLNEHSAYDCEFKTD